MKLLFWYGEVPRLAVFFCVLSVALFKTEASLLQEVDAGTSEMTDEAPPFDTTAVQFPKLPPPSVKQEVSGESVSRSQDLCYIEIQVSKKVPGRCIQLGRTARGCVSGRDMRLFHRECM